MAKRIVIIRFEEASGVPSLIGTRCDDTETDPVEVMDITDVSAVVIPSGKYCQVAADLVNFLAAWLYNLQGALGGDHFNDARTFARAFNTGQWTGAKLYEWLTTYSTHFVGLNVEPPSDMYTAIGCVFFAALTTSEGKIDRVWINAVSDAITSLTPITGVTFHQWAALGAFIKVVDILTWQKFAWADFGSFEGGYYSSITLDCEAC
jgi:hypothetical protein